MDAGNNGKVTMMDEREVRLGQLNEEVRACPKCPLARTRTKAVPGEGPIDAEIMFVGEGPGFHEDRQGQPFVGQAGHFLEELLASIDLRRDQVFITNVVKCRPPENRDPAPMEIAACAPYLDRQLELLSARLVVTLGRHSMARYFPGQSISRIHGQPKPEGHRIILPLFHPAAGLRSPAVAEQTRQDVLRIPALLDQIRAAEAHAPGPSSSSHGAETPGARSEGEDGEPQQLTLF